MKRLEAKLSLACAFLLCLSLSCNFSAGSTLVAPYGLFSLEHTVDTQLAIFDEYDNVQEVVIPAYVFAVGSNKDFIIAKQNKRDERRKSVYYYIVAIKTRTCFGTSDEQKFAAERAKLGVPADLEFTRDTSIFGGCELE